MEIDISQSAAQAATLSTIAAGCATSCAALTLHDSLNTAITGLGVLLAAEVATGNFQVTETVQSGILKIAVQAVIAPPPPPSGPGQPSQRAVDQFQSGFATPTFLLDLAGLGLAAAQAALDSRGLWNADALAGLGNEMSPLSHASSGSKALGVAGNILTVAVIAVDVAKENKTGSVNDQATTIKDSLKLGGDVTISFLTAGTASFAGSTAWNVAVGGR